MKRAAVAVLTALAAAVGVGGAVATPTVGRILLVTSFANKYGHHVSIAAVDAATLRVASIAPAAVDSEDPALSHDGRQLAFARGFLEGGPALGLYVADARGAHARRIAPFGLSPTWSPDGSRLAYVRNQHVVVLRRDGTHARRLSPGSVWRVAWSPHGNELLLERGADAPSLQLLRPDGSGVRMLLAARPTEAFLNPAWSPDGRQIAYEHARGCAGGRCGGGDTIEVADLAGHVRESFDGFYPAWSPDGKALAYATGGGVFVRSLVDGSTRQVFAQAPETFGIAWARR